MTKINTQKAGFSLIEVLFAMVFLSVVIFGVIRLQTSNLTLSNTKQLELRAYSYAQQALEIVEALGYTATHTCTAPCYITNGATGYLVAGGGSESLESGLFKRSLSHDEAGLSNATLFTATVTWTDSAGDNHSVSAQRVIFKG